MMTQLTCLQCSVKYDIFSFCHFSCVKLLHRLHCTSAADKEMNKKICNDRQTDPQCDAIQKSTWGVDNE